MGFKALNKYIIKDIVMVIIGSLITALGINMFLIHANLLSGGLSGITLIIQYVTGFPAAYSLLILNIPLFFLSYKKVNKKIHIFILNWNYSSFSRTYTNRTFKEYNTSK